MQRLELIVVSSIEPLNQDDGKFRKIHPNLPLEEAVLNLNQFLVAVTA